MVWHLCLPLAKVSLVDTLYVLPQLVELKNGETFNGHLVNCDNFMNITLREVYQTSADGDRFWKVKECYIRGSTVRRQSPPQGALSDRSLVAGTDKISACAGRAAGCGQGGTDARTGSREELAGRLTCRWRRTRYAARTPFIAHLRSSASPRRSQRSTTARFAFTRLPLDPN